MEWQDLINGSFELLGGPFIFFSIIKLYKYKVANNISLLHPLFFSMWGLWNLYYYPYLNQFFSFLGGIMIFSMNITWLLQIFYYRYYPGGIGNEHA